MLRSSPSRFLASVLLVMSACAKPVGVVETKPQPMDPIQPILEEPSPQDLSAFASVDRLKGRTELLQERISGASTVRFAESLHAAVDRHHAEAHWSLGGNENLFGLVPESERVAVSLATHPLCGQSGESLQAVLGHDPGTEVAGLANDLAERWNLLRSDGRLFRRLNSRLIGCLAYAESLTTADTTRSQEVAQGHGPEGYVKPSGVKFYLDAQQTHPDSKLNIGLFQFSPASGGNIQSCMRSWNRLHPDWQIPLKAPGGDMVRVLGNASQDFNAFCGVNKIAQIFYVQANTTVAIRTHPSNHITGDDGVVTLKSPKDRCVSLHFNAKAYNHFGPLQNSTRKNLREVLSCVLAAE